MTKILTEDSKTCSSCAFYYKPNQLFFLGSCTFLKYTWLSVNEDHLCSNYKKTTKEIKMIDNLTLGELKEISKMFSNGNNTQKNIPIEIGKNYFIRTVTMYYTGKVKAYNDNFITLSNAAWIADCGRFHDFLKNGTPSEVEPYIDDVCVSVSAIVDFTEWRHQLPSAQK